MKWQHFLFVFFLVFGFYLETAKVQQTRVPASVDDNEAMRAMAESGGF